MNAREVKRSIRVMSIFFLFLIVIVVLYILMTECAFRLFDYWFELNRGRG